MSNLVKIKDSQWLQLDVCKEFQRNNCQRTNETCKYAHPASSHEVVDGKVMACYDSCKGRCLREVCKYYHPSPYLIDTLLTKGRNHLAFKNSMIHQSPSSHPLFIPISTEIPPILFPAIQTDATSNEVIPKPKSSLKRSADESFYQSTFCKRQAIETMFPLLPSTTFQPVYQFPTPAEPSSVIPMNASFVNYTDANGQLLDNLPVCQDFNRNICTRINCKFVHLLDPKKLEIHEQRVAVCRDHANLICRRQQCKYYHIPITLPSATEMASNP